MAVTPPLRFIRKRMRNATRDALGFLDLVGQSDPGLRHIKQRNFAPAIRKPLSDFEAMGGVQPVARYNFAGRHPHPQYVFSHNSDAKSLFRVPKKKLARRVPGEKLRIVRASTGWHGKICGDEGKAAGLLHDRRLCCFEY